MNGQIKLILLDRLSRNGWYLAPFFIGAWFMLSLMLGNDPALIASAASTAAFFLMLFAFESSSDAQRVYLQLPVSAVNVVRSGIVAVAILDLIIFLPVPLLTQALGVGIGKELTVSFGECLAGGSAALSIALIFFMIQFGMSFVHVPSNSVPRLLRIPLFLAIRLFVIFGPFVGGYFILRFLGAPGLAETMILVAVAGASTSLIWLGISRVAARRGSGRRFIPEPAKPKVQGAGFPAVSSSRAIAEHFLATPFLLLLLFGVYFGALFALMNLHPSRGSKGFGIGFSAWIYYGPLCIAWIWNRSLARALRAYRVLPISLDRMLYYSSAASILGALAFALVLSLDQNLSPGWITVAAVAAAVFGLNVTTFAFYAGWGGAEAILSFLLVGLVFIFLPIMSRISGPAIQAALSYSFVLVAISAAIGAPLFLRHVLTTRNEAYKFRESVNS